MSGCQYAWGGLLPDCISVLLQMGLAVHVIQILLPGLATEKLVKYLENHIQSDYPVEEKMACLKAGYRYAEKADR